MSDKPAIGSIGWFDLTVPQAEEVKTFYEQVVGWTSKAHPMGDYDDYEMLDANGRCVAGVCHQKGVNADVPSQWMLYVNVADLDESLRQCEAHGGERLGEVRDMGPYGRLCIVRDPAGAAIALLQPPA